MLATIIAVGIGLGSGYLSGQLGIGGATLTTPAIRLLLRYPAVVAVGTPLVVIIPTTLTAAIQYGRADLVDWHLFARVAPVGLIGVIAGAYLTAFVPGGIIMLVTAAVMVGVATRMALQARSIASDGTAGCDRFCVTCGIGLVAGLMSGFLGLGGGVVLVPGFTGLLGRDVKEAFGTSLAAISVFALPGSAIHYSLGHVDPWLALLLVAGVVPGAWLGARVAIAASDRTLRLAFAVFLFVVAIVLAVSEIKGLLA